MNDEFLLEDIDDDKTIEFVRNYISTDLKEKLSDDDLEFFLDTISDYYCDHGVFDQEPDADGCVDVDVEAVATYLVKEAKKHGVGDFDLDEMIQIVAGELEFGEQLDGPDEV
ncbi:MAG: hypothetical protein IKH59_04640 [Bacteroidaceae bacterium]|jgi:hypothetical protein|nr:hypothetical protein [Bacteroidaceae bacterium]